VIEAVKGGTSIPERKTSNERYLYMPKLDQIFTAGVQLATHDWVETVFA
jgi:hypothetical protein